MAGAAYSKATVDLTAYGRNIAAVRALIPQGCAIMAVVKANAYGHGLERIAEAACAEGVDMLGVATVEEGVTLRKSGIRAPILVLVQVPEDALGDVIEHNLRLLISEVKTVARLGELARRANKVVPIHCKVDSGMGRQGFLLEDALREMRFLTRVSHVDIEGVATHFPDAERAEDPFTLNQIKIFKHFVKELGKEGIPFEMVHAANSAAVVNYPSSAFDMVRPGLMTYGVWPTEEPPAQPALSPVLKWTTRIALIKELPGGRSVGYGRTYITQAPARTAVLPVGYADGYRLAFSNRAQVLIRGQRCPVIGRVSMDQTVVDVTEVPMACVGDVATLIGDDGSERVTAVELAAHADSIPYEILTGIGARVQREYVT